VLIKYAIIVMMVLFSVLGVSLCVEGPTESCGHGCCLGSERSRLFTRGLRRLRAMAISVGSPIVWLLSIISGAVFSSLEAIVTIEPPPTMNALRI
jgi:hypothetical protein